MRTQHIQPNFSQLATSATRWNGNVSVGGFSGVGAGVCWGGNPGGGRDISGADGDDGVGMHSRTVNVRRPVSQNINHDHNGSF
jgi:hypothetical protein